MVIHRQVRVGHAHRGHLRTLTIQLRRGCLYITIRAFRNATNNPLGVQLLVAAQTLDCIPHLVDRVLGQQLKHADVLPNAGPRAVTLLQALAKFREHGGQLPAATMPAPTFVLPSRRWSTVVTNSGSS